MNVWHNHQWLCECNLNDDDDEDDLYFGCSVEHTTTQSLTYTTTPNVAIVYVWASVWNCIRIWQAPAIIWYWGCCFSFPFCMYSERATVRDIFLFFFFLTFYGHLLCISHLDRTFHVRHSSLRTGFSVQNKIRAERTQYEWQTSFCVHVNVFCAQMKIRLITICQLWRLSFQMLFFAFLLCNEWLLLLENCRVYAMKFFRVKEIWNNTTS